VIFQSAVYGRGGNVALVAMSIMPLGLSYKNSRIIHVKGGGRSLFEAMETPLLPQHEVK